MLKPIPQENPENIRKVTAKKAKRFMAPGPGVEGISCKKVFSCKIQQKMQAEAKKDRSLLHGVCARMIQFIRKNGQTSKQELHELIHGLQRSVLSLERQKQRAFNKEQRKKKKS